MQPVVIQTRAEKGNREEVLYWTPRSARRALTWFAGDDYPQVRPFGPTPPRPSHAEPLDGMGQPQCALQLPIAQKSCSTSAQRKAEPLMCKPLVYSGSEAGGRIAAACRR